MSPGVLMEIGQNSKFPPPQDWVLLQKVMKPFQMTKITSFSPTFVISGSFDEKHKKWARKWPKIGQALMKKGCHMEIIEQLTIIFTKRSMSHIIWPKVTKFHWPLLITLGATGEKPEGAQKPLSHKTAPLMYFDWSLLPRGWRLKKF